MENLTELIASEIKKQYKSVRRFAMHIGIPQTTLFSVLKNGISGTAFDTVVKICQTLGINIINYQSPVKIDDEVLDIIQKYNFLDEMGMHTVKLITDAEYIRCSEGKMPEIAPRIAAFGGALSDNDNSSKNVQDALRNIRDGE